MDFGEGDPSDPDGEVPGDSEQPLVAHLSADGQAAARTVHSVMVNSSYSEQCFLPQPWTPAPDTHHGGGIDSALPALPLSPAAPLQGQEIAASPSNSSQQWEILDATRCRWAPVGDLEPLYEQDFGLEDATGSPNQEDLEEEGVDEEDDDDDEALGKDEGCSGSSGSEATGEDLGGMEPTPGELRHIAHTRGVGGGGGGGGGGDSYLDSSERCDDLLLSDCIADSADNAGQAQPSSSGYRTNVDAMQSYTTTSAMAPESGGGGGYSDVMSRPHSSGLLPARQQHHQQEADGDGQMTRQAPNFGRFPGPGASWIGGLPYGGNNTHLMNSYPGNMHSNTPSAHQQEQQQMKGNNNGSNHQQQQDQWPAQSIPAAAAAAATTGVPGEWAYCNQFRMCMPPPMHGPSPYLPPPPPDMGGSGPGSFYHSGVSAAAAATTGFMQQPPPYLSHTPPCMPPPPPPPLLPPPPPPSTSPAVQQPHHRGHHHHLPPPPPQQQQQQQAMGLPPPPLPPLPAPYQGMYADSYHGNGMAPDLPMQPTQPPYVTGQGQAGGAAGYMSRDGGHRNKQHLISASRPGDYPAGGGQDFPGVPPPSPGSTGKSSGSSPGALYADKPSRKSKSQSRHRSLSSRERVTSGQSCRENRSHRYGNGASGGGGARPANSRGGAGRKHYNPLAGRTHHGASGGGSGSGGERWRPAPAYRPGWDWTAEDMRRPSRWYPSGDGIAPEYAFAPPEEFESPWYSAYPPAADVYPQRWQDGMQARHRSDKNGASSHTAWPGSHGQPVPPRGLNEQQHFAHNAEQRYHGTATGRQQQQHPAPPLAYNNVWSVPQEGMRERLGGECQSPMASSRDNDFCQSPIPRRRADISGGDSASDTDADSGGFGENGEAVRRRRTNTDGQYLDGAQRQHPYLHHGSSASGTAAAAATAAARYSKQSCDVDEAAAARNGSATPQLLLHPLSKLNKWLSGERLTELGLAVTPDSEADTKRYFDRMYDEQFEIALFSRRTRLLGKYNEDEYGAIGFSPDLLQGGVFSPDLLLKSEFRSPKQYTEDLIPVSDRTWVCCNRGRIVISENQEQWVIACVKIQERRDAALASRLREGSAFSAKVVRHMLANSATTTHPQGTENGDVIANGSNTNLSNDVINDASSNKNTFSSLPNSRAAQDQSHVVDDCFSAGAPPDARAAHGNHGVDHRACGPGNDLLGLPPPHSIAVPQYSKRLKQAVDMAMNVKDYRYFCCPGPCKTVLVPEIATDLQLALDEYTYRYWQRGPVIEYDTAPPRYHQTRSHAPRQHGQHRGGSGGAQHHNNHNNHNNHSGSGRGGAGPMSRRYGAHRPSSRHHQHHHHHHNQQQQQQQQQQQPQDHHYGGGSRPQYNHHHHHQQQQQQQHHPYPRGYRPYGNGPGRNRM
ncbi:uncharacterized protein LOC135827992 [Sycon ciliatum]|uniref:uncharacterized protein LOC135827992 n=1 Tax=Sycon ciliatum TaxID=27933 RepID=UPI0031F694BB